MQFCEFTKEDCISSPKRVLANLYAMKQVVGEAYRASTITRSQKHRIKVALNEAMLYVKRAKDVRTLFQLWGTAAVVNQVSNLSLFSQPIQALLGQVLAPRAAAGASRRDTSSPIPFGLFDIPEVGDLAASGSGVSIAADTASSTAAGTISGVESDQAVSSVKS